MQKLHVAAAKALVFDMPKVKILPHPEICPEGAEFELNNDESLCEGAPSQRDSSLLSSNSAPSGQISG